MKRILVRPEVLAAIAMAGIWLTGCSGERSARFGVITGDELRIGDYAPDFSFVGQNGAVETFGKVREVVTVVAFPDDPAWPDCSRCKEVVQLASETRTGQTPIAVVSIATPARRAEECAAALHRCAVQGRSQLIALHDHAGRVRALYGRQAVGKYYIVDWTGRIAATGPLSDRTGMEKALREAVAGHQKHWNEMAPSPQDH